MAALQQLSEEDAKLASKCLEICLWFFFEGFGPCWGGSHPTHPHLGEISQKKTFFFGSFPYYVFRRHPEGKITQVQLLL